MFARLLWTAFALFGCAAAPTPTSLAASDVASAEPSSADGAAIEVVEARADEPAPSTVAPTGAPAGNESPTSTATTATTIEYQTPLLDRPALARAARAACEASFASGHPLVIEFSAPWCDDCVALQQVKASAPLASEIENWELLPINIGGGFEHSSYMAAYKVTAIAKLVIVHPRSCADPPTVWTQLAARTLDGLGKHKAHVGEELARWLETERAHLSRSAGAR